MSPTASTGSSWGGTSWKLRTGATWVREAHRVGKPCHVGRVGSHKRVLWARAIGADSIDSCLPLFSAGNLAAFMRALRAPVVQARFDFTAEER